MQRLIKHYHRVTDILSSRVVESGALLLTRLALAGVFWRSGRTKVVDGSWLEISDTTLFLFQEEYTGVPLPAAFSAHLATYGEHLFPILLVLGLATRLSALSLLGMSLTIQFFVYPDAWWPAHSLWVAMSLILVSRGAGMFSFDTLLGRSLRA
ncbi:MAG: DoxX family protein [Congregibacter sp.]|nr:DoxX family protein [Congregibacter sp.]MDP5070085.1 DoxX family protein [Congregibacter sp.]